MNWRCRLFGHKLRPLEGKRYPDGAELHAVNIALCEREGTVHAVGGSATYEIRGAKPGRAYPVNALPHDFYPKGKPIR